MTVEMTARIVSDGKILAVEIPAGFGEQVGKLVRRCGEQGVAMVSIATPRRLRSTGPGSQSHHLNGHVQAICVATGNDFDTVKQVVKQRAIGRGYPFSSFKGVVLPQSEANASTEECSLLIDEVHQLAAELGISLPETEWGTP